MFRFSRSSKGQFFIIASVIIISVLFSIYSTYLGYYAVDTSLVQDIEGTYLLKNIELQTKNLVDEYENSECSVYKDKIKSFRTFVETSALESGNLLRLNYTISRGCIYSNFKIDVRSRETKVSKSFASSRPATNVDWNMYDQTSFNGGPNYTMDTGSAYTDGNIEITASGLVLKSGANSGRLSYTHDPNQSVVWYMHKNSTIPSATSNVKIYWWINESEVCGAGVYCRFDRLEDLPEEFRWLKQTIELTRMADLTSPTVTSTNMTYAIV